MDRQLEIKFAQEKGKGKGPRRPVFVPSAPVPVQIPAEEVIDKVIVNLTADQRLQVVTEFKRFAHQVRLAPGAEIK